MWLKHLGCAFMAGYLRRLKNLLSGRVTTVLHRPEQRLAAYISDVNKRIRNLERGVARATDSKERFQNQIEALRARSTECETRILAALERGNENLAKAALEKQEFCDAEAAALECAWKAQSETTSQLVASLKLSRSRREEAQRKHDLLVSEHRWAETREKIRARALKIVAPALIAQLEDKIRTVQAEAEGQLVLNAESVDAQIDAGLQVIDTRQRGYAALEQFKARLADRRTGGEGTEESDGALDRLKAKLAQRKAAARPCEATERIENLKRTLDS